jgi:DNA-binding beta-propeller fold protein YncE
LTDIVERKAGVKIGGIGKLPGQFDQPYGIAVDSKGSNVYVAENRGRRVHKFRILQRRVSRMFPSACISSGGGTMPA